MSFLNVNGVGKKEGKNQVLNKVSFSQERFQKIAIAGETGSGKSTLLKIIAGLIQPLEGMVEFENEKVLGPEEKLMPGHPRIAYLSQHFELRNNYTVEEVLIMANKMTEEDAQMIYDVCRISHLLKRRTDQLSGGEKQRIAIARLLISSPKLLLLDEPYSNLDMVHKQILKAVINDIGEELKITCILISHDALDTLSWADEILVMKDGQVIQKGKPQQIYKQPVNEYTAGLFGKYNLISPSLARVFTDTHLITQEKKILVRPEGFKIVAEGKNGVKGKVNEVFYFGSYNELRVEVNGKFILIKCEEIAVNKGEEIYVYLPLGNIWYV